MHARARVAVASPSSALRRNRPVLADRHAGPAAFAPLPTDEPVRKGMLAIRDLVRINHSLVTHRRMPPDHAHALPGR